MAEINREGEHQAFAPQAEVIAAIGDVTLGGEGRGRDDHMHTRVYLHHDTVTFEPAADTVGAIDNVTSGDQQ